MRRPRLLFIVASLLTSLCIVVSYEARGGVGNALWDLDAYSRATHDYRDGIDPYRTGISDVFVYHPFVLGAFYAVETTPLAARLMESPLRTLLLSLYLLSTGCFLWQLWRFVSEHAPELRSPASPKWTFVLAVLAAVGYGKAGATSYLSGNLTTYLHFAVLAVLLKAARSNDKRYLYSFVVAVAAASLVKPYVLAYILALTLMTTRKHALHLGGTTLSLFAAAWLFSMYAMPLEYSAFHEALRYQTVANADFGYSVFGLTREYLPYGAALFTHVAVMGVLGFLFFARQQSSVLEGHGAARLLLLAAFAVLANPRLKEYDTVVLVLCLFSSLCLRFPRNALVIICVGLLTAAIGVFGEQFRRWGYDIPPFLADTQSFEMAGLLATALMVCVVSRGLQPQASPELSP